ncbi:glycoside hydrolase family 2 TIM barrel-domain containing protein [uncultured Draconibacterium sp.]|uniref:glycoside hydrolase family 2 TIM barrel-domain containing protein n=1 Tax=uncultured Draconibacterium sp. TaxID=1573823 RepID=UPI0025E87D28|nr:glycoside hydrolase family 2 TIM barrel-domain containing protein [uncultured Draconibacterium sp.]
MNQKSFYISILLVLSSFFLFAQTSDKQNFNQDWKFKLLDENEVDKIYSEISFDATEWSSVSLPHSAHIEPLVVNDQWQGVCWYRKVFKLPASYKDKKVFLEFEAAMNTSGFCINGKLVTEHMGGYLPVVMDISEYMHPGEENLIAVRLDNTDNPITGPKPLRILDYNTYGGLYRNAWLITKNKVHITHPNLAEKVAGGGIFITTPTVENKQSDVHVKTHILNESIQVKSVKVQQTILFKEEQVAEVVSKEVKIEPGSDFDFKTNLEVNDAALWSPDSPALYHLKTLVIADGEEVDSELTRFGIRSFKFKENQLYINGKKTFLRGVNRHQEYPFIGYALSDNAQYRDAKKIKDGGFDYIRLSHYPHSSAFMDACDELGLVVIDAISGWQYYNDSDDFRNYCYRSAEQLIRRDRNHPSVLAWEVSLNETQMPLFFMEEIHKRAHAEDPRPDAYTCGWKPEVYDIYLQARQHRLLHPPHDYPKPYSVSEYGDWEYYSSNAGLNQHHFDKQTRYETSSRQARGFGEARLLQQATNVQEAHNDNLNTPAYSDSYWVMYDYNRGYHDDLELSGLMDIYRLPKFAYYFYQSQRAPEDGIVCQLATYWTEESPLGVSVYSNCDEIELFLNGRSLGRQKPDQNKISNNLAHPPFTFNIEKFEAGELKAIGFIKGEKATEGIVKTPQKATALKLWIDESGKAPVSGCNDVLFVYIAAVDVNGTVIPGYSELIDLKIEGEATIVNSDPIKAEAGIATALIQIGDQTGEVTVIASASGLSNVNIALNVQNQ